jgi:hypothetical protein
VEGIRYARIAVFAWCVGIPYVLEGGDDGGAMYCKGEESDGKGNRGTEGVMKRRKEKEAVYGRREL